MNAPPPPTRSRPTATRRCFRSARTPRPTAKSSPRACGSRRHGQRNPGGLARGDARAGRGRVHRHQSSAAAGAPRSSRKRSSTTRRRAANDRFVAYDLLKNANIAAGGVLPMCQDTGTAIIMGKKGRLRLHRRRRRGGARRGRARRVPQDATCAIRSSRRSRCSRRRTPRRTCRRRSRSTPRASDAYKFLFIAKGGGSANKAFLFQATPSILTHERMLAFLKEKILTLGTAACPPYHLAIVIGGTSAELTMKTVKLASTKYLDNLPTKGSEDGHAFRDLEMEQEVLKLTQSLGVGAQFGGKYFCHDVRVIRLPRHGASLPIGLGVSCSADRQAIGKITRDGVFLEELEHNPAKYLPEVDDDKLGGEVVQIDLNRPMKEILRAAVAISGQDAAVAVRPDDRGARHRARQAARAAGARAGAARLFQEPSGLLRGPRQDARRAMPRARSARPRRGGWIPSSTQFQAAGGSMVMLAKGNRSPRGARGLQEARRLLSRLDRRRGGEPGPALHQEGRDAGISRARHGSDLAHRGGEFPGLHRDRRQGQRFLQGTEFGVMPQRAFV